MPFVFAMGNDITFMLDEIKPSEQTHQLQDNFPIARQTSQDYTCTPTVFESSCEGFTSLKIIYQARLQCVTVEGRTGG